MNEEIFISYKSEEAEYAYRAKKVLEDNGFTCWMAPDSILAGDEYTPQIHKAIDNCKALLFVVSENAQKSNWIKSEVHEAFEKGKIIIPYMIQDCQLEGDFEFKLNKLQKVFAYQNEEDALEKVIRDLRVMIKEASERNEPIKITIEKNPKKNNNLPLILLAAAVLIAGVFLGVKMMSGKGNNSVPAAGSSAGVYYSEILPYTKSGVVETYDDVSSIVNTSLKTDRAFSIVSFLRNQGDNSAFVEQISCEILELEPIEKAVIFTDNIIKNNQMKIFAFNNGWDDGKNLHYEIILEDYKEYKVPEAVRESVQTEGTFDVKAAGVAQLLDTKLDTSEVKKYFKENQINFKTQIGNLSVYVKGDGIDVLETAFFCYDPQTDEFELSYGGKGDGEEYSITLYAILDVDKKPSSLRFTGEEAAPLVQDTFRIETVIIPTKSCRLVCKDVYSVAGQIQETDEYSVEVQVPVYGEGNTVHTASIAERLFDMDMRDEIGINELLQEYRYDPQSVIDYAKKS